MNFEMIKKFGVIEVIYENYDDNNKQIVKIIKDDRKDDCEREYLTPDEINYIKKYWKIDFDYTEDSDNSGNTTGRKIIWYYIKHIFSPFKNFRRIRKIFRR